MIVICELGHEWNTEQREGKKPGNSCGALIYFSLGRPEDTRYCWRILKEKPETLLFEDVYDSSD